MKRIVTIILSALLFAISFSASATVAYPYPIKVTQPDGSVITIQLHGDEYCHWITCDGQMVEKGEDGFYHKVSAGYAPVNFELAREKDAPKKVSSKITTGKNHFLVVLVNFSDLKFSVSNPNDAFSNMLNGENYTANGGTGSVSQYYSENSANAFQPTFDVVGPVTVSKGYSYYGAATRTSDDAHAALAFYEAVRALDATVDFSKYDLDGDGLIDNIFFYFAGHNEAEGASSDHIWPHQSDFRGMNESGVNLKVDGKTLSRYACSSELKGYSGKNMTGIGTFCHEFGHVLGLMDFYDTDYETNGEAYGMGPFSLMSSGNYNNNGCTPPALTGIERNTLGWMKEITEWTEPGEKTVPDIMDNQAFMTGTSTNGEFFVYEARGGSVWDSYIGSGVKGLLIYHVDRSTGTSSLWSSNKINAYGSHPCCQIEPSSGKFVLSPDRITYPGAGKVTSFDENSPSPMVDWSGSQTGRSISNIVYSGDKVTLTVGVASGKKVSGTVKDKDGNPVVGATVVLTPVTSSKTVARKEFNGLAARSLSLDKAPASGSYDTVISSDGTFSFDLSSDKAVDFTLTVSCHGYVDYVNTFRLVVGELQKDVVLRKIEVLDEEVEFEKFDWKATSAYGFGQPVVGAVKYTADELAGAVGSKITYVGFALYEDGYKETRIIIDFGDETVLDIPVTDFTGGEFSYVDISEYNLLVPADKDVYVGLYVDCGDEDCYPFMYNSEMADMNGFFVRLRQDHNWVDYSDEGSLTISFVVEPTHDIAYMYGFNGIANPGEGHYAANSTFELKLVESNRVPSSVDWYFDGNAVKGTTVKLTAGEHTARAVLHFADGQTETIEQILVAE